MLSLKTKRHAIFVCIPGISGSCNDNFDGYSIVIDAAADKLLELARSDNELMRFLDACTDRMEGYQRIAVYLGAATVNNPWLRKCASTELCRFVFDQLQPKFEQKKEAISEQIDEARRVIERFRYRVPAVITQTTLSENLVSYGFRFDQHAKVGDVLKNTDHTESKVLAVVHPEMA